MGIPVVYRTGGGDNLASYDFYDLFTGTGYKEMYGGDASGALYISPLVFYGRKGVTSSANNGTLDIDFDITFEVPTTLEGDCIINVPFVLRNGAGSAQTPVSTVTMELHHVDTAAAETSLGSVVDTLNEGGLAATTSIWTSLTAVIDITKQIFKVGESLRLSVTTTAPGSNNFLRIGHDPKNRSVLTGDTITWTSSQTTLKIPLRLQLS